MRPLTERGDKVKYRCVRVSAPALALPLVVSACALLPTNQDLSPPLGFAPPQLAGPSAGRKPAAAHVPTPATRSVPTATNAVPDANTTRPWALFPPGEIVIENQRLSFSVYMLNVAIPGSAVKRDFYKETTSAKNPKTYPAYVRLVGPTQSTERVLLMPLGSSDSVVACRAVDRFGHYSGNFHKGCSFSVANFKPGNYQLSVYYQDTVVGKLPVVIRSIRTNHNTVRPIVAPETIVERPYSDNGRALLWVETALMAPEQWTLTWVDAKSGKTVAQKTETLRGGIDGMHIPLRRTALLTSSPPPGNTKGLRLVVFHHKRLVGQYRLGPSRKLDTGSTYDNEVGQMIPTSDVSPQTVEALRQQAPARTKLPKTIEPMFCANILDQALRTLVTKQGKLIEKRQRANYLISQRRRTIKNNRLSHRVHRKLRAEVRAFRKIIKKELTPAINALEPTIRKGLRGYRPGCLARLVRTLP